MASFVHKRLRLDAKSVDAEDYIFFSDRDHFESGAGRLAIAGRQCGADQSGGYFAVELRKAGLIRFGADW
jgi:hypothetical protein